MVTPSYSSALLAATTAWVMDAMSFSASPSSAASNLTLRNHLQSLGVKVSVAGDAVTSVLLLLTAITTLEEGCVFRLT